MENGTIEGAGAGMSEEAFRKVVEEEWDAVPRRFAARVENVALLIEDEPDRETRREEGLEEGHTLLGLYRGIPATARGEGYGDGGILPDTITLYRLPILQEAQHEGDGSPEAVRIAVRETLWHEIGHYFGYDEETIREREDTGTNRYRS